jgi:hypothetical protein
MSSVESTCKQSAAKSLKFLAVVPRCHKKNRDEQAFSRRVPSGDAVDQASASRTT